MYDKTAPVMSALAVLELRFGQWPLGGTGRRCRSVCLCASLVFRQRCITDRSGAAGQKIVLALSGSGTRAMAFHAGVLRFLAEKGVLEQIGELSTVSGSSLLVGPTSSS